jgi:hypothetical protein
MLGRLDGNGTTGSATKIPSASLATGSTAHRVPLHLRGHPCLTIRRSRPDRGGPLRDYCTGLVMPCERKSVEPIAAITAPGRTAAQHQSLLRFVGQSPWSDEKVLAKVGEMVLPTIERQGRSRRGSSMTPAFLSRESTRWAWRDNIAANSASRTYVLSKIMFWRA